MTVDVDTPRPPWNWPQQPPFQYQYMHPAYYGQDTAGCQPYVAPTEDRIREIIREELAKVLEALKAQP